MPLGVAYPTLSYTPTVSIADDATKELHAFRIDFKGSPHASKITDRMKCRFSEIEMSSPNSVPRQLATGVSYYWGLFFLPGSGDAFPGSVRSRDQWIRVRLYRRGFKTLEIGPDDSGSTPPAWEEAKSTQEREEAIDSLLGVKKDTFSHLQAGHDSKKHEAVLHFAADEYSLLANSLDEKNAEDLRLRTRIMKKYQKVRQLEAD